MPRLLFNFKCENEHVTAHLVNTEIREMECDECGALATRQLSAPHFPIRQGVDPDMHTAAWKWEKMQRSKNREQVSDTNNTRYLDDK